MGLVFFCFFCFVFEIWISLLGRVLRTEIGEPENRPQFPVQWAQSGNVSMLWEKGDLVLLRTLV